MTEITDQVYVSKDEVSSIQEEIHSYETGFQSDSCFINKFIGSVITLKNGRKIYVKNMTPKQIIEKLRGE